MKLGILADIVSGFAFDSKRFNSDKIGTPIIRIRDVSRGFTETYFNGQYDDRYLISQGDFLITMDGEFKVAEWTGPDALLNQRVCKIFPMDFNINPRYLLHMLPRELKRIEDHTPFVTVKHLSVKKIKDIQIPLPPLPVQRRIAAILDAADEHRRKTQALIEKYDELAQSVFLEMFGDPVRNENKFPKIKLSSLSKISSGSTPSRNVESYYKGNIPWVKTGEVDGGYITHTEEHLTLKGLQNSSCNIYPSNSILIAMYGQGKTRGKVAMIKKEMTTNQACAVIEPSDKYNSKFLFYQLQLLYEDLRQLGRGGNQPNLNVGIIKNYEVLNPRIDLQSNFNSLVSNIEDQKISLIKSLEGSEALFQSLLQRAFRGELVTEEEEVVE